MLRSMTAEQAPHRPSPASLAFLVVEAVTLLGWLPASAADFEVRSPMIDEREVEIDVKFARSRDSLAARSGAKSLVVELELTATPWWSPAIEGEWGWPAGPGEARQFRATTFESRFAFAQPGAWWADVGLFVEYERGVGRRNPTALRVGPTFQKVVGPVSTWLNVSAVRERGAEARAGTGLVYAFQARWMLHEAFQPGIEAYGGTLESDRDSHRQHLAGPVVFGSFDLAKNHDLRFELGYLHALQGSTPKGTFKLLLGWEHRY